MTAASNIINKGTGAGGAKTNVNGLSFESLVSNEQRLLAKGFVKTVISRSLVHAYYLSKEYEDRTEYFVTKKGLHYFVEYLFDTAYIYKQPDEAYFTIYNDGRLVLKVLEKKNQNTAGSVDEKLYGGASIRRLYEKMFEELDVDIEIHYAYCLSKYLQNKLEKNELRSRHTRQLLEEQDVPVFFGEDEDYFDKLDAWTGITAH
jgi:hypothetical protein